MRGMHEVTVLLNYHDQGEIVNKPCRAGAEDADVLKDHLEVSVRLPRSPTRFDSCRGSECVEARVASPQGGVQSSSAHVRWSLQHFISRYNKAYMVAQLVA